MNDFTTKDMADLLYRILSEIKDNAIDRTEVVLQTPTTESKYPCRVVGTPLESVTKTERAIPVQKMFQVSIEHWDLTPESSMEMVNRTDEALRSKNFIRTTTNPLLLDEKTKKYKLITTYEVRYNIITNSLEFIR